MKKVLKLHWIAMALLCTLLAVGCAKKPAPAPTETVMTEQPVATADQATGLNGSAMNETAVAETEAAVAELQRIHFDFDQFTLSAEARDLLAANAAYMQANGAVRVRIEGYCDERGSDEYNIALGDRRAKAAKDYLVSLGVDPSRLETISYGEEMPLDPSSNEAAWAKNRRDEFKAIK